MDQNIIDYLSLKIEESILPLIDCDYVFLDLPYHPNVGDTLIAMAAKLLLSRSGHRCLYYSSEFTFDHRDISEETLIIFNGGGNFGDLWRNYSVFRNMVLKKYPKNHYLIMPQSVYYQDTNNLCNDIQLYSSLGSRITICARDEKSYVFLKTHFTNNTILLVPDLAFYTEKSFFVSQTGNNRILFLKRNDSEFISHSKYDIVPEKAEIHDWPTLEKYWWIQNKYTRIKKLTHKDWYPNFLLHFEDRIWQKYILPYNLRSGIRFVNQYDIIYTTRLHVAILGALLDKKVYFFDNSYGKNSSLYNTWLKDCPNIELID